MWTYGPERFRCLDPAGNRIPGAPNVIATAGINYGEKTGWFGAAKFRYLGPTPLIVIAGNQPND